MADTVHLSTWQYETDPGYYWFGVAIDNGVTFTPVPLTANSVVVVEIQQGSNWGAVTLEVAQRLDGSEYAIRTIVPMALANGQERTMRVTIDGVLYGPWIWRFYGGGG